MEDGLIFVIILTIIYITFSIYLYKVLLGKDQVAVIKIPQSYYFYPKKYKRNLRWTVKLKRNGSKHLSIVFFNVKHLTAHSFVLLYAMLDDLKYRKKNLNLEFGKNHQAKKDFFNFENCLINESKSFKVYTSDRIVNSMAAAAVDYLSKLGNSCKYDPLYVLLIELMDNSYFHFIKKTSSLRAAWWYSMEYNAAKECISYTFFDFGPGILKSYIVNIEEWYVFIYKFFQFILKIEVCIFYVRFYVKNVWLMPIFYFVNRIYHLRHAWRISFINDHLRIDYQLKSIFDGDIGSTTGQINRGKGLPKIKQIVANNLVSSFFLITKNVTLQFQNGMLVEKKLSHKYSFEGTFYYWEINKQNLRNGEKYYFNS